MKRCEENVCVKVDGNTSTLPVTVSTNDGVTWDSQFSDNHNIIHNCGCNIRLLIVKLGQEAVGI